MRIQHRETTLNCMHLPNLWLATVWTVSVHVSICTSRLWMKKQGSCRPSSTRRFRLWAAAPMRSTAEARWRKPKPRNCCLFPAREIFYRLEYFHPGLQSVQVAPDSCQLQDSVLCKMLQIIFLYIFLHLAYCISLYLNQPVMQVRNARPCWRRLPDWGRREALRLERTAFTAPCSPAEEPSASPTSSCLSRWSLFAPPTTNQVGLQKAPCIANTRQHVS